MGGELRKYKKEVAVICPSGELSSGEKIGLNHNEKFDKKYIILNNIKYFKLPSY